MAAEEGAPTEGLPRSESVVVPALVTLQRTQVDPEYGYHPPDDAPEDVELWCTIKQADDPPNWQGTRVILRDEFGHEATRLDNVRVWFLEGNACDERVAARYRWTDHDRISLSRWWIKSWLVFEHVSRSKISEEWKNGRDIDFRFECDDAVSGAFLTGVPGPAYGRFCGTRAMRLDRFHERVGRNLDYSILAASRAGRLVVSYRTRINWRC